MDENIVISSSSSSSMLSQQCESPQTLQQKLKLLLQSQPQWWNYAIFWHTTTEVESDNVFLSWAGGHFQGFKSPTSETNNIIKPERNLGLASSSNVDDVVFDAEWFYMTSPTQSYSLMKGSGGVLARALNTASLVWLCGGQYLSSYNCDRAKEAHAHGLETLVCIPISNGILELGSIELINENWVLIRQAQSIFGQFSSFNVVPSMEQAQPSLFDQQCDSDGPLSSESKVVKKRGRRTGLNAALPANHVEAERLRREKMNSRFYALRSVVPTVSKMDKASLLADAVAYIKELRDKVDSLESQLRTNNHKKYSSSKVMFNVVDDDNDSSGSVVPSEVMAKAEVEVEVRAMGSEAMIRVQSKNINHPCARLMNAFKDLELQVHHASISTVQELILQDVIVKLPEELNTNVVKAAILKRLHRSVA